MVSDGQSIDPLFFSYGIFLLRAFQFWAHHIGWQECDLWQHFVLTRFYQQQSTTFCLAQKKIFPVIRGYAKCNHWEITIHDGLPCLREPWLVFKDIISVSSFFFVSISHNGYVFLGWDRGMDPLALVGLEHTIFALTEPRWPIELQSQRNEAANEEGKKSNHVWRKLQLTAVLKANGGAECDGALPMQGHLLFDFFRFAFYIALDGKKV
ncbi:hypothetical protein JHK87_001118 [Glycine soja]|nr:hypothetical protein JHK87_001118 [Glycine soja]